MKEIIENIKEKIILVILVILLITIVALPLETFIIIKQMLNIDKNILFVFIALLCEFIWCILIYIFVENIENTLEP